MCCKFALHRCECAALPPDTGRASYFNSKKARQEATKEVKTLERLGTDGNIGHFLERRDRKVAPAERATRAE